MKTGRHFAYALACSIQRATCIRPKRPWILVEQAEELVQVLADKTVM
jgi:hypothetical protein